MPKRSYQLINPVIEGTFKDVYDAAKPIAAAESLWKNLTVHISGHVPRFMFTMKNISSGELHHFEVTEKKKDNSYTIKEESITASKKDFDQFLENVDNFNNKKGTKQKGGVRRKRYEDDDDSSSSTSDIYPTIKRTSPIALFHYNTRVYYSNNGVLVKSAPSTMNPQVVGVVSTPVFTPVFTPPVAPFVAIW